MHSPDGASDRHGPKARSERPHSDQRGGEVRDRHGGEHGDQHGEQDGDQHVGPEAPSRVAALPPICRNDAHARGLDLADAHFRQSRDYKPAVPTVCQAPVFPQVRAWQSHTRCGWE